MAITGATGFVGKHLVRRLRERGAEIIEVAPAQGYDVRSFETLDRLPPFKVMVHLAARTFVPDAYESSLRFFETNVSGTIHCLELCRRRGAALLFASSYVYGTPRYLPIDEEHPTSGWNPYAATKLAGEAMAAVYARDFGVPVRVLRFFNIYGPGQGPSFLVPTIVAGIRSGRVCLRDGAPRRDYVYVMDVVSAIERSLESEYRGFRPYNVGSGRSHSVTELVEIAQRILGVAVPVEYAGERRVAEVDDVVADVSRIGSELGWTPTVALEAGLRETIAWDG